MADRRLSPPRQYCGAKNPDGERYATCVLSKDHRSTTHQDMSGHRWSDRPTTREAIRALFDGPNACGIWLENLLHSDEPDRITDAVMAVLEARTDGE